MKSDSEREKQLRDRLVELDEHVHEIEDALDEPVDQDVEERSVERESDEVLESLGNAELKEIRMIQAALDRLGAGEYGYCAECGERISEERLDVLPHTPFCRNHAS